MESKTVRPGKYQVNIFTALFVFMPVIVSGIIILICASGNGFFALPGIKWNDEADYLQLIRIMHSSLQPDGYFGFNGNHAILGTGSAWNPAVFFPYFIFSFIIPTGPSFVFIVNLILMVLANVSFFLLVRPAIKNQVKLVLLQAVSPLTVLYLCTGMTEIFRFSLAIVLAGIFWNMFFTDSKKWIKYILAPLVLIYAVQVYTFFAFAIPIYVYALLKNLKKRRKSLSFLISIAATALVGGGSYYFLHLISSNYNIGKTETLLADLSSGHILTAVADFFRMVKDGLSGLWGLKNYVRVYPLYPGMVIFFAILVIYGLILMLESSRHDRKRKPESRKRDGVIGKIVVYSVLVYVGMYVTLYTIVPDTFIRGTFIVVVFSVYLLAMVDYRRVVTMIFLMSVIVLSMARPQFNDFLSARFMTSATVKNWNDLRADLSDAVESCDEPAALISGDKESELYANTVMMYTMEPKVIASMPTSLGLNFVLEDDIFVEEAGYMFFTKRPEAERRADWVDKDYDFYLSEYGERIEDEYTVVYESDDYIMYARK